MSETSPFFVCPNGFGEHLYSNVYSTWVVWLCLYIDHGWNKHYVVPCHHSQQPGRNQGQWPCTRTRRRASWITGRCEYDTGFENKGTYILLSKYSIIPKVDPKTSTYVLRETCFILTHDIKFSMVTCWWIGEFDRGFVFWFHEQVIGVGKI